MILHRDVDPDSSCRGQIADGRELFGTDCWCVYCGAKFDSEVAWAFSQERADCILRARGEIT